MLIINNYHLPTSSPKCCPCTGCMKCIYILNHYVFASAYLFVNFIERRSETIGREKNVKIKFGFATKA